MSPEPRDDALSVHASFSVIGSFDPDEVTQALGMAPHHTARRGVKTATGSVPNFDVWSVRTEATNTTNGTAHVAEILSRMASVTHEIQAVRSAGGVDLVVGLVAVVPDCSGSAVPYVQLSLDMLRELASLGAEFAVDITLDPGGDAG